LIKIEKVNSKKELNSFIRFPWKIYNSCSEWVPPLIHEQKIFFNRYKNPFFKNSEADLFLARNENGKILGRIAAIRHQEHLEIHQDSTGFFGFFECIDDQEVANSLFEKVTQWLKEKGLSRMRGPMNFTINDSCGLLIEGFDFEPAIDLPYNPSYYEKLISNYGLTKTQDLFAFNFKPEYVTEKFRQRVMTTAARLENKDICLRPINLEEPLADCKVLYKVYEEAWQGNWGHVPIALDTFLAVAREKKKLFNREMCLIIEYKGNPAGAFFAFPDYAPAIRSMNGRIFPFGFLKFYLKSRQISKFRVILLGIFKKYRNLGLESLVLKRMDTVYPQRGYNEAEFSWILESNKKIISTIENLGAKRYKTYRIFDKNLNP